ncbi:Photosystem II CP43 reaction center protein [Frankliniella fusca]|uniref:Photosystem II CP43 reaction center protein n=1 Tax=Frankliniella fusca TaxID=407009 RepID=A0AAE1LJ35_9NEOP|nr:Photosystem II CP43 reaction center protein [Frankliniella fusca]
MDGDPKALLSISRLPTRTQDPKWPATNAPLPHPTPHGAGPPSPTTRRHSTRKAYNPSQRTTGSPLSAPLCSGEACPGYLALGFNSVGVLGNAAQCMACASHNRRAAQSSQPAPTPPTTSDKYQDQAVSVILIDGEVEKMDQSAAGPSRRSGRTRKETQIRCDQCYLTLPSNEYATHLSQHHASAASTTPAQVPGPSNEPPLRQKRMVSRDRPKTPAAPTRRRKKGDVGAGLSNEIVPIISEVLDDPDIPSDGTPVALSGASIEAVHCDQSGKNRLPAQSTQCKICHVVISSQSLLLKHMMRHKINDVNSRKKFDPHELMLDSKACSILQEILKETAGDRDIKSIRKVDFRLFDCVSKLRLD